MKNQEFFRKLAVKYPTAEAVQKYLKSFKYVPGQTVFSARTAIEKKQAHCLEGAFVAAAIMEQMGHPPLVLSLESQDGLDHVLYLFNESGRWGTIGQSRDEGLFGRPAVFRSLRDLAWSYFDPYIDETGKVTAYQKAHLDDTRSNWRSSPRNVWKAENYLLSIQHHQLKASQHRYKKIYKKVQKGETLRPQDYWW